MKRYGRRFRFHATSGVIHLIALTAARSSTMCIAFTEPAFARATELPTSSQRAVAYRRCVFGA